VEELPKRFTQSATSSRDGEDTQPLSGDEAALLIYDQLLKTPIAVLREAVEAISPSRDPEAWADAQFALGWALRLRGRQMSDHERAQAYLEAVAALEATLTVFGERVRDRRLKEAATARDDSAGDVMHEKAVDLVVASTRPLMPNDSDLLKQAVHLFRLSREEVKVRGDIQCWLLSTSNLACALTLLAKSPAGKDESGLLDEAVDLLRDILCQPNIREMTPEYVFAQINLADAFRTIAERATLAERVHWLESTLHSLAEALRALAPERYGALIELYRAVLT
jgi:hypothetical protein